mmetsp:Transcript_6594/g.8779  ORF Transcript_6594/g.8779 Transcript_6594/m.8779 type:complete len:182 (+) Transcript_6594:570-1115(+)
MQRSGSSSSLRVQHHVQPNGSQQRLTGACLACKKAHHACDQERPKCARCVRLGASCEYRFHKKPGRKRLHVERTHPTAQQQQQQQQGKGKAAGQGQNQAKGGAGKVAAAGNAQKVAAPGKQPQPQPQQQQQKGKVGGKQSENPPPSQKKKGQKKRMQKLAPSQLGFFVDHDGSVTVDPSEK